MEERAFHVRTVYSQKKHGSQVPQALNSERILVQPLSAGNNRKYVSYTDYRRNSDPSRDNRLRSGYGKSNEPGERNLGGQPRRDFGTRTNPFSGSSQHDHESSAADPQRLHYGQGSNPFSESHGQDESIADRQRFAHCQSSRPYSAFCDESMTSPELCGHDHGRVFSGVPAASRDVSESEQKPCDGFSSWTPSHPRCSTAPVVGNVIKKRPDVPPRLSQLRSNVFASESNSGDFGSTTRKKSAFVPLIPELSPNSFSRAWQKAEEELKLQNELGDGQRRRDWSQVDFMEHEIQDMPDPLNLEEQEPAPAPKIPKRQRLPTQNVQERDFTPEAEGSQRESTPEPGVPEPDPTHKADDRKGDNTAPEPDISISDPTSESESELNSPERPSTPMPELVSNRDSAENSPSLSPSSSEDSMMGVKDREKILALFTVNDLKSDDDANRFQTDSNTSKLFYSILNSNGVAKYQMHLRQIQSNLESFALTPVAVGFKVTCRITRDKRGVDRNVFPNYYLYLELGDGRRTIILTARKRKKSTTSNYLISVDPTDLARKGDSYIGKVRSNLLGTQFTIFDNGVSPKPYRNSNHQLINSNSWINREELGTIIYETNVLGLKGPRKLRLLVPSMKNEYQRLEIRPGGFQGSIAERLKRDELTGISDLRNKTPIWNHSNQSYCLNFSGRVSRASVKNFQIVHDENQKYIILQFGRTDEDQFSLDFGYPLCPLQAFAIALSSFDTKIACE